MKKLITTLVIAASALLAISGCSHKANLSERKAAFSQKITTLQSYGFDANKTIDTDEKTHYVLEVKDAKKAALALLRLTSQAALAPDDLAKIAGLIENLKRAQMDIDWKKYAANEDRSVYVYLSGTGKEDPFFKKLMAEKKLGLYLSYDAHDTLRRADVNNISEKWTKGDKTANITLKDAYLLINKAATKDSPSSKMDFHAGALHITAETNGTKKFDLSYDDPHCTIDKSNAYLGTWDCLLPHLAFSATNRYGHQAHVSLAKTKLHYTTASQNQKVESDGTLHIDTIAYDIENTATSKVNGQLDNLEIGLSSKNIDESAVQQLYALVNKPRKNANADIRDMMKLISKMFLNGAAFHYDFKLKTSKTTMISRGKTSHLLVDTVAEKGDILFDKTIGSNDTTTIKLIQFTKQGNAAPQFELKNFVWNTKLEGLYNFLPDFLAFSAELAESQHQGKALTKKALGDKYLNPMLKKIVNTGAKLTYGPIAVDGIQIHDGSTQVSYGKMQLDLNAQLAQNTLDLKSPMGAMMLLSYLNADGKIVLNKTDLEKMAKDFSPKMMAMVMMFARYEGDKAVFKLEFKKGHLTINGKPVM